MSDSPDHLAEVHAEWATSRVPPYDAAQAELSRGIGTALLVIGALLVAGCVALGWIW